MKPRRKPAARGPTVWERLGPAFAENLGFGLAAFLILAGAVYFATTAWTTMSGEQQLLVMVGGLILLGGLLYGAGRLLNRGGRLPEVERTLLLIVTLLVPIAAIPAGNLFALSTWRALLASAIVLVSGFLVTRRLARVLDGALTPFVPIAYTLLSALVLAGGPLGRRAPLWASTGVSLLLVGVVWMYARRVVPRVQPRRWAGLWPGILMAFAASVFAARVAIGARLDVSSTIWIASLGIVVAALGASLATLEPALFRRRLFGRRRSAVALVVAIALGIAGTLMAVGDDVGLFVASLFGAYACLRAGFALPQPWLALPGMLLSALAYLKSPAPVRAAALQLRDQAADALGYADRPMPLAWYGITFLPYVFACAWVGWVFLKRNQTARARVFFVWAFVAALGLSALALFASGDPVFSDLRAPAAVFAAQGLLLLAIGFALRHRGFTLAGALGIFAGAACAVLHPRPAAAVVVLALSAMGLVAVAIAAMLARRGADRFAPVRAGLLDATAFLTLILFVVAMFDTLRLQPAPWWHGLGYLLLTVLLSLVAFALRRPEGIALAAAAMGAAGARIVVGLAPDAGGDLYFLALAALSGVVLLTPRIDARLPAMLRHPDPVAPGAIGSWTPLGALAIQLLGFTLLLRHLPDPGWTWTLAAGFLVGSLVLLWTATKEHQPWPLYPAVLEFLGAGVVAGVAWAGGPPLGTGGLAGAGTALALMCVPLLVTRPRRVVGPLAKPLRHLLPLLVALFAVWAFGLVIAQFEPRPVAINGWLLAAASFVVALAVRFALARTPTSHALRAAALYAGTLFAPAAAGILFVTAPPPHAWPLAFAGAAAAVFAWSGRDDRLRGPALLHLALAFGTATYLGLIDRGDPRWLLVAFAVIAVGGWIVARRLPVIGWVLTLLAILVGVSLPLATRMLAWDPSVQPTLWLVFAALAYLSLAVPRLRVDKTAVHLVADPILGLGILAAAWHAVQVVVFEPSTAHVRYSLPSSVRWLRYAEGALGLAALARSVVLPFSSMGRRTLAFFVLGLATFALAPVNMWIHGSDARFWRPDVELALLALLLAWLLPLSAKPRATDGTGDLGPRLPWPILLAGLGLVLTLGELRDLSTPLTVLAATLTLFVLLVRDRGRILAGMLGLGVLATALAFASWWKPMPGAIADGVLLLYGAVSALVAPLLAIAARRFAREGRPAWIVRAGRELYPVAVLAAVLAFAFVAADVVLNAGRMASSLEIALAGIGLGLPGAVALWGALRADRPRLIHVALLAGLLFYTFLVQRSELLAFLDGYHLHVLVVFASTCLFFSSFEKGSLGRLLAIDGLLLTVPAIVRYVPAAFSVEASAGKASSALALAAVVMAIGARRLAWPLLYGVAAALVNLMLFAFWQRHGLVDPAFYGIPPGLTLLGGAVLLRGRITRAAHLALVIPGLALLYGSVALQVVRANEPVHALILFGLGLATVLFGFLTRRNAWMVVGVVVIVLDVVVYLLAHGFENGFFGAALLVVSGLVVMAVAGLATFRRRAASDDDA